MFLLIVGTSCAPRKELSGSRAVAKSQSYTWDNTSKVNKTQR
jgi:hypothetical protein